MGVPERSATQVLAWACVAAAVLPAALAGAPQTTAPATGANRMVSEADCTAPSLVATIAPEKIGEPVRSVTVEAGWVAATDTVPAHCRVDGVFAPVDTAPTARVINFRVILPASWNRRGAQIGGGGINGIIPNVAGGEFGAGGPTLLQRGFATYGSDSGHQLPAFGRRGGPPPAPPDQDWALNEEAIRNFGYAQMKKTHDAAMVLIQRMYGERPRFNYYLGTSQGGREALPEQRRPRSVRHERERLPHRRPDLDARVRVLALQVCVAARQRGARVRHVDTQHRSVGQRTHSAGALQRTGRRRGRCPDALAPRRSRRHRLPDAGRQSKPA